jgi:hypothetical protein
MKFIENLIILINIVLSELLVISSCVLLNIPHQCTDDLHIETGLVGTMLYLLSSIPLLYFHQNHHYSLPLHHMPMSMEYSAQYCYTGSQCLDTLVFLTNRRNQIKCLCTFIICNSHDLQSYKEMSKTFYLHLQHLFHL